MTWRERATTIIQDIHRGLPDDATLDDRIKALRNACPSDWRCVSWPQKAWQAARRDYLVKYGYVPKTKKHAIEGHETPLERMIRKSREAT